MQRLERVVYKAANTGEEFTTRKACLRHEALATMAVPHECPACRGEGSTRTKPVVEKVLDPEATAYGGFYAQPVYRDVTHYEEEPCKTCGGAGYTPRPLVPVVESKVVGYK